MDVAFRQHPIISHRNPCSHNLLKEVITKTDKKFYPLKSYCYYPIVKSLSNILNRQSLIEQCEHWRSRSIPNNRLADIYDGKYGKNSYHIKVGLFFLIHITSV